MPPESMLRSEASGVDVRRVCKSVIVTTSFDLIPTTRFSFFVISRSVLCLLLSETQTRLLTYYLTKISALS